MAELPNLTLSTLNTKDKLTLARIIAERGEEIFTLRAQLQRYGGHTAECARHGGYWVSNLWWVNRKCSCGWAEIAAGFDKGKGE